MSSQTVNRSRLFTGCIVSLVATAFGFAVRGSILENWRTEFQLTSEQIGYLQGAGLFPFAISIILFSLIIDKLGNGKSMAIAFTLHVLSAIVTLAAPFMLAAAGSSPEAIAAGQKSGFILLYIGTFIFALGNGTVEAVVNPVTATLFPRDKAKHFNMLHAGWPGGLVLGGLLSVLFNNINTSGLPGRSWQWQMGLVLVPTLAYGFMMLGQKFPVQERVAAKVPYFDMLKEFGAGSCYIVSFFLVAGLNQILLIAGVPTWSLATQLAIALIPTLAFAAYVKSFGQPIFVLLLLVMVLLATTELGTDSWIADIMTSVLGSATLGTLFLVWTSLIMFVLRFFAGPVIHKLGPLGVLAVCSSIAATGLLWLSTPAVPLALFAAATFYGCGKSFFWPTTLGVVSERYPRGGALMLNAIAGVGMISVGTLGNPAIGMVQDMQAVTELRQSAPDLANKLVVSRPGLFGSSAAIDPTLRAQITDPQQRQLLTSIDGHAKQAALSKIAVLPCTMLVCYLFFILYFRAKGGYQVQHLAVEGVPGD